jgi:hypothetical protein
MSKEVERYTFVCDIENEEYVLASDYEALLAERDRMSTALDEIGGLCRALRQGGPDPMDLEDLSNALEQAVDLAHAALQGAQP